MCRPAVSVHPTELIIVLAIIQLQAFDSTFTPWSAASHRNAGGVTLLYRDFAPCDILVSAFRNTSPWMRDNAVSSLITAWCISRVYVHNVSDNTLRQIQRNRAVRAVLAFLTI